ncbi:nucleoside hydrolase [Lederbergia citrea]|uniref:nucleoside hydrolase n=1 Tax=Lederbergia citrea TaxID=2833581 RepID=UPI003211B61F
MKLPIIIDTDPGIDDVVAITAALFSEQLDVQLITTVGGNVGIENTTRNALNLVHFLGKDTPVARGANEPLMTQLVTAAEVHGESGVGTYQFPEQADESLLVKEHAVLALRNKILQSSEPVTLVPIGPLTNIGLLLKMYPETKENIKEIVLMGGAVEGGNATSVAEFNIFVDPHAAKIVFDSNINIVMCGLDITRITTITDENIKIVEEYGKVGKMVSEMLSTYGDSSSTTKLSSIHDLCTIFYLTRPELFTVVRRAKVDVVTEGPAFGCTVAEYREDGNVQVCLDADVEAFRLEFITTFKKIFDELEVLQYVD